MIISLVLLVIVICVLSYCVVVLFDRTKPDTDTVYPFNEAMDMIELPVLTLSNNGRNYRFILDSGSNGCHLDKRVLDKLDIESTSEASSSSMSTGAGVIETSKDKAQVKFSLGNTVFSIPFFVEDLSQPFDYIKKTDGMTIHGILGSNFLRANKWVLDFAKNVAYMKK